MDYQQSRRNIATFVNQVDAGADAAQVADAILVIWQAIEAALSPIIGVRGVAALFKRSIYLASAAHTWLADTPKNIQTLGDLSVLKESIIKQTAIEAATGSDVLLSTFYKLLISLVGQSLTQQLLRSVQANFANESPAQDTLP